MPLEVKQKVRGTTGLEPKLIPKCGSQLFREGAGHGLKVRPHPWERRRVLLVAVTFLLGELGDLIGSNQTLAS